MRTSTFSLRSAVWCGTSHMGGPAGGPKVPAFKPVLTGPRFHPGTEQAHSFEGFIDREFLLGEGEQRHGISGTVALHGSADAQGSCPVVVRVVRVVAPLAI